MSIVDVLKRNGLEAVRVNQSKMVVTSGDGPGFHRSVLETVARLRTRVADGVGRDMDTDALEALDDLGAILAEVLR